MLDSLADEVLEDDEIAPEVAAGEQECERGVAAGDLSQAEQGGGEAEGGIELVDDAPPLIDYSGREGDMAYMIRPIHGGIAAVDTRTVHLGSLRATVLSILSPASLADAIRLGAIVAPHVTPACAAMAASLLTAAAPALGLGSKVSVGMLRDLGGWASEMVGGKEGLGVGPLTRGGAEWALKEMTRLGQVMLILPSSLDYLAVIS